MSTYGAFYRNTTWSRTAWAFIYFSSFPSVHFSFLFIYFSLPLTLILFLHFFSLFLSVSVSHFSPFSQFIPSLSFYNFFFAYMFASVFHLLPLWGPPSHLSS